MTEGVLSPPGPLQLLAYVSPSRFVYLQRCPLREVRAETMLRTHPERMIEWAVAGMLPKTKLGRAMVKKLKVYPGREHPHAAQQPEPLDLFVRSTKES